MKKLILLAFAIILSGKLIAQNYKGIIPGNISHFQYTNNVNPLKECIRSVSSDSISTVGGNSEIYNYLQIETDSEWCYPVNYHTWMGYEIIQSASGYEYYLNTDKDTIGINTLEVTGQPWTLYNFPNGDYLEAVVTSEMQDSFLSLNDSTKIISLQAKNSGGNNIPHPLNLKTLKLSQHYGWVETLPFKYFPDDTTSYHLMGISNPQAGYQTLGADSIFNYAVGDTFQYHSKMQSSISDYTESYTSFAVINKLYSAMADTIFYTYDRRHYFYQQVFGSSSSSFVHDTTSSFIVPDDYPYLNEVSEKMISYYAGYGYAKIHKSPDFNSRWQKLITNICLITFDDTCNLIATDCGGYSSYVSGIGLIREDYSLWYPDFTELLFYSKGSETWGNRINWSVILGLNNLPTKENGVTLVGNVFTDDIKLISAEQVGITKIILRDMMGREVLKTEKVLTKGENSFSTQGLSNGVYTLTLSGGKTHKSYKVIKQMNPK